MSKRPTSAVTSNSVRPRHANAFTAEEINSAFYVLRLRNLSLAMVIRFGIKLQGNSFMRATQAIQQASVTKVPIAT